MNAPARGPLLPWFDATDEIRHLRDRGWALVSLDRDKCAALRASFQVDLRATGFTGDIDLKETKAAPFPLGMWSARTVRCSLACVLSLLPPPSRGIDVNVLPRTETAMDARILMMEKMGELMGCDSLVSSFDGVMISRAGNRPANTPYFDPARPRVPTGWDKEKKSWTGGHIDQKADLSDTARSFQAFLCLCDADLPTLSTCLLVPREGWSFQGITDAMRAQFPDFFASVQGDSEGYKMPPYIQDWLVDQGMAEAVKPRLKVGDMLIWSSSMIHGAGAARAPRGTKGNVRLGIISGFCPAELLTRAAQVVRYKCVATDLRCTGQQVFTPTPHLVWAPAIRYSGVDGAPAAYGKLRDERLDRKKTKRSLLDDTEPERADYRAKVARLLGPRPEELAT